MSFLIRLCIGFCGLLWLQGVSFAQHNRDFSWPQGISDKDYAPHTLIVKFRQATHPSDIQSRYKTEDPRQIISSVLPLRKIEAAVPNLLNSSKNNNSARSLAQHSSLENIYKVYLEDGQDLSVAIQALLELDIVAYAEPYYLLKPLEYKEAYVPNDPEADPSEGSQAYLSIINAYEAWEIEKGDSSVMIGILDTGIEFGHQDLSGNLWQNTLDPINGIDDDGDGLVDNFQGWDFADNDNDPSVGQNIHGIQVSGVAAATTDNGIGVSGTGFNSSYVPFKIFKTTDGSFAQGYEAIAYAADLGCKVINLSWGGANAFSNFGQDIINYAVLVKDAVVVAAAGNGGKQEDYYPASYNHVLSVAQTDGNDLRRSVSTSSYFVDLTAPGHSVFTTSEDDAYAFSSGSSMATPQVAGAAALLRAHYPELNALQVMEKLRLSTDDIYGKGNNAQYLEQLGKGRLNMGRALSDLETPALRMSSFSYQNHVGNYVLRGDTLRIKATFTNFLGPTTAGAQVKLSSPSSYVSVLDSSFSIGVLDTLQQVSMDESAFTVYLHQDLPQNEQIYFRLAFEDGEYTDYQYFFIVSSQGAPLFDNGKIQLSLASDGDMGQSFGVNGFQYQGEKRASSLGFILAASQNQVSDNSIRNFEQGTFSNDFNANESIHFAHSSQVDMVMRSSFNDANADQPMNLSIDQSWLSDTSGVGQNYLIAQYRILNEAADTLFNLKSAIFADWDIGDIEKNKADWDDSHQLGYVFDGQAYQGVALLTGQDARYRAIDLSNANGNTADIENVFSDSLKNAWLTEEFIKTEAGTQGDGNDVAHMVGANIDALAPGQHQYVAFSLLSANSLEELQNLAEAAKEQYYNYRSHSLVSQVVYACTDSSAWIQPLESGLYRFYQDALGEELLTEDSTYTMSDIAGDTAIYVAKVEGGVENKISELQIRILQPEAAFQINSVRQGSFSNDTLFLNSEGRAGVQWQDTSIDAASWQWNLGNGFESKRQHPFTQYENVGEYQVSLKVLSRAGCESFIQKNLTVVRRLARPAIEDQWICEGSAASLSATNTNQLEVYSDESLTDLLFSGDVFTTSELEKDTVFYVVNAGEGYPSTALPVNVKIMYPDVAISHSLSLDTTHRYLLKLWPEKQSVSETATSKYRWRIGGQVVGTSDTLYYDYAGEHARRENIEVELLYTAQGEIRCDQRVLKSISLKESPMPEFTDQHVCRGESVTLMPTNGSIFYFYEDENLAQLLHKGRSLSIDDLNTDQTYYITNLDSLGESKVSPVRVIINQFADFNISEDTIYLSEQNQVSFEAFPTQEGVSKISWSWDLGDGRRLNRGPQFTHTYDTIGIYQVTLYAQNEDGCTNTIRKMLTVLNVTATGNDPEDTHLQLFPNPGNGTLRLSNVLWLNQEIMLYLYDAQGKALCEEKLMYQRSTLQINLHELSQQQLADGLYFLELRSAKKRFFRKLIIHQDR